MTLGPAHDAGPPSDAGAGLPESFGALHPAFRSPALAVGKRPKVLYVDDERANLVAFRAMLRDSYDVLIAESAAEGYGLLRSDDVLVVVSDQRMPGQTGAEFLGRVAAEFPETVRIILTGYSDIDAVIGAVNEGKIFYYFRKPWAEPEVRMILRNAVHDILNQRRLSESERKYRTLVETTRTGYAVMGPEGTIVDANQEFVRLTGRERFEAVVGHRLVEWTAPHDVERTERALREILESGLVRGLEIDYVDGSGRVTPVEVNASAIASSGSRHVVAIVHDITERRRAEEAVRRLNKELEGRVAERTAALEAANRDLESFSYSVSHDLRAPLRAIDGFSSMLASREEGRLDEESVRLVGVIRQNTARMGELIEAMLVLSRVGRAEIRKVPVDMAELARAAFGEVAGPGGEGTVEFRVEELPEASGDPVLLRQVWTNLLSNALKYSSHRESPSIEVGSREEGGRTAWYVRDNGAGFDPNHAEKIFLPFQRLHVASEFPGLGVGLTVAERIVLRHGGAIGAQGKVGEGATFWFTL